MADTKEFRDALQAESLRRFPGNSEAAKKARKGFRNSERVALGYKKEGRGGLAGVWDRNKDVITPIAAGALGLLTGGIATPMLAAAAARGLDREGKGGIGFDVGDGVRGAVEGAAAGSVGKFAGGLMGAGSAAGSAAVPGAVPASSVSMGGVAGMPAIPAIPAGMPITAAPASSFSLPQVAGKAKDWLTANGGRNALSAATAVSGVLQQQRGNQMMADAAKAEERRWAENAPLRNTGRDRLMSGVPGNPFAQGGR